MNKPELNISNEEIGLINAAVLSFRGSCIERLALAASNEEAANLNYILSRLDIVSNKLRDFATAVNNSANGDVKVANDDEAKAEEEKA